MIHTAPRVLKAWNFVSDEQAISLNLNAWHRSNSGNGVLDAVRAGMGIARLGDWLAEPLAARGELVRLCPAFRIVSSHGGDPQMHAVFASRGMPRKARLLLDALRLEARHAASAAMRRAESKKPACAGLEPGRSRISCCRSAIACRR
ncbi:LysR substrate binding domain [Chromobacterium violaceum]|uniref:LysR substrate binding domain n=1 Tax=Chromobacterium violaceum TaxID=536 RepID=A0A3S5DLL1_CHRVL|nr:LysR substrate binding domain [Chromobacterium violaceum]